MNSGIQQLPRLITTGASDLLWLAVVGFFTGIVALLLKGDSSKPKQTKGGNTAAVVAIAIAGGLAIAIIIALASWGGHGQV